MTTERKLISGSHDMTREVAGGALVTAVTEGTGSQRFHLDVAFRVHQSSGKRLGAAHWLLKFLLCSDMASLFIILAKASPIVTSNV